VKFLTDGFEPLVTEG